MVEFCVYYHDKLYHKYYVYYYHSKRYEETYEIKEQCDSFEHSKLTKKSIQEQLKLGLTLEQILKEYAENRLKWRDEILSSKKLILPYDDMAVFNKSNTGTKYKNTNESNIMRFFNNYSTKIQKYKEEQFDEIVWIEYKWFEKSNKKSMQRCINKGLYETLGYDFKMAYPHILSSKLEINNVRKIFHFPTKEGKIYKLEKLEYDNLKYGLYRVNIETDNEEFKFSFSFNTENIYTHYEIEFCHKYREKYNIKIDLIIDGEYNSLLYENDEIIDSANVFEPWMKRILDLKSEFPKNGLVKLLSSSMWGYLSKKNKRYYNDKELDKKPEIIFDYDDIEECNYLCLNEKDNKDGTTDYLLIDKKKPYCKKYRLKPFILAFMRLTISEIILQIGYEKVVRVNTDNITFNRKLLTEEDIKKIKNISKQFIEEEKTTTKENELMQIDNVYRLIKVKK